MGYCGQISLGTGAFMAVGAYAAYNFLHPHRRHAASSSHAAARRRVRHGGGGVLRHPVSLRIKGLYLAVATLAAQFFVRLGLPAHQVVHQRLVLGLGVSVANLNVLGIPIDTPVLQKYLFCLAFLVVFAVLAKNLVRSTSAASGWPSATWTWPPR